MIKTNRWNLEMNKIMNKTATSQYCQDVVQCISFQGHHDSPFFLLALEHAREGTLSDGEIRSLIMQGIATLGSHEYNGVRMSFNEMMNYLHLGQI